MRQRKNSQITSRWSVGLRQISGLKNQSKEKFSNSLIRDKKNIGTETRDKEKEQSLKKHRFENF